MEKFLPEKYKSRAAMKGKSVLKTIFAFKEDKAYTMTELGKNIGVANPRMTILIDELESMNIVERIRDNKDRRIVKVKLTEKGKDLREQFMQKRRKEVLTLFSRLKPEQRQDLLRCLKKTSSILENIKTKED